MGRLGAFHRKRLVRTSLRNLPRRLLIAERKVYKLCEQEQRRRVCVLLLWSWGHFVLSRFPACFVVGMGNSVRVLSERNEAENVATMKVSFQLPNKNTL